jgi:hypothetical protein
LGGMMRRQPRRNLVHLGLAARELRALCRPPCTPAQMNSFAAVVKSIHAWVEHAQMMRR